MKLKQITLLAGCMLLLCGCTKSNIVKPQENGETIGPDFNIYMDIKIDEEQLQEDVDSIYLDAKDYPMGSKIVVDLNLEEEQVDVTVVVKDGTSSEDAASYAMRVIKGVNDEVATQDFSYGESGDDTYGGLYQDNAINVKVYHDKEYAAGGEPIYEAQIPKDVYQEIVIEE